VAGHPGSSGTKKTSNMTRYLSKTGTGKKKSANMTAFYLGWSKKMGKKKSKFTLALRERRKGRTSVASFARKGVRQPLGPKKGGLEKKGRIGFHKDHRGFSGGIRVEERTKEKKKTPEGGVGFLEHMGGKKGGQLKSAGTGNIEKKKKSRKEEGGKRIGLRAHNHKKKKRQILHTPLKKRVGATEGEEMGGVTYSLKGGVGGNAASFLKGGNKRRRSLRWKDYLTETKKKRVEGNSQSGGPEDRTLGGTQGKDNAYHLRSAKLKGGGGGGLGQKKKIEKPRV